MEGLLVTSSGAKTEEGRRLAAWLSGTAEPPRERAWEEPKCEAFWWGPRSLHSRAGSRHVGPIRDRPLHHVSESSTGLYTRRAPPGRAEGARGKDQSPWPPRSGRDQTRVKRAPPSS